MFIEYFGAKMDKIGQADQKKFVTQILTLSFWLYFVFRRHIVIGLVRSKQFIRDLFGVKIGKIRQSIY